MIQHKQRRRAIVVTRLRSFGAACFMAMLLLVMGGGVATNSTGSHQFVASNVVIAADPSADPSPSPSPSCNQADDSEPCRPVDDNGGILDILKGIGSLMGI